MDYTQSDAYATDVGTGNRLHQQSAAVTTAVSDKDLNGLTWEVMAVISGAGLSPIPFDKTVLGSYTQLKLAINAMIASGVAAAIPQDYKASVRAGTTANIAALVGGAPNTLDGVALVVNDRILVKDQTTGSQNGIYVVTTLGAGANGTWTRATDADGAGELTPGAQVTVEEGATLADTVWVLATSGTVVIGTTALTFKNVTGAVNKQIQSLPDPTLASNAMTLPAAALTLDFRSSTLGTGVTTTVSGTAAALTIPAGATLGALNGQQSTIVNLILNNGGVLEHAVVNLTGGNDLFENGVISTTAISAASTANNVIYSATARTNVPYRVVRVITSTQATAGQWATAPSLVQGAGGQALAALSALGYGQTLQTVTGSRALGTTYYNMTGKPIFSHVVVTASSANSNISISLNGAAAQVVGVTGPSAGSYGCISVVIPAGFSYAITASTGTLSLWHELR